MHGMSKLHIIFYSRRVCLLLFSFFFAGWNEWREIVYTKAVDRLSQHCSDDCQVQLPSAPVTAATVCRIIVIHDSIIATAA